MLVADNHATGLTILVPRIQNYRTWQQLVVVRNAQKQRQMIADITALGIDLQHRAWSASTCNLTTERLQIITYQDVPLVLPDIELIASQFSLAAMVADV